MNITNMKRLKTHLELEGQKFKYACYVGELCEQSDLSHQDDDEVDFEEPASTTEVMRELYRGKCGTVGCLAGMAAAISLVEDNQAITYGGLGGETFVDVHATGRGWLGLNAREAEWLFLGEAMNDKLDGFESSNHALSSATPLDAAKLLQILIDEEEQS